MPHSSGTQFGPYEIVAALGTIGMGYVYRRRDLRLDRTAAGPVRDRVRAGDWRRTAKHSLRC
jgi:hypothetical protein